MTKLARPSGTKPMKQVTRKQPLARHKLLLSHHLVAAKEGLAQMTATPLATFITCLVIAMTLFLTSTCLLALGIFQDFAKNLNANNQVTLYLKTSSPLDEINALVAQLKQNPLVVGQTYIAPEQALKELLAQNDYNLSTSNTEANPLPPVILLKTKSDNRMGLEDFINQLKTLPLIENIHVDFKWLDRLLALLTAANRITYVLTVLFSLGVLFIVTNTILGATQRNHKEIVLLDLIGATLSYIRRPLLYLGTFMGLAGGLLALAMLFLLFLLLKNPVNELLQSYQIQPEGLQIDHKIVLITLASSTFLGWLGSLIAFYKYYRYN